ncbi:MAG: Primase 1 [Betaproteobacteria bacterium]|nr:Primase 1 [Betaproteobacteria bacterium]
MSPAFASGATPVANQHCSIGGAAISGAPFGPPNQSNVALPARNDESPLLAFLTTVLPHDIGNGNVFVVSEKPEHGRWANHPCESISALATRISELDAAGSDTYFALGAFRRDGGRHVSRKQENAVVFRALWLDVDVGPAKPYKSQDQAVSALESFCESVGLPQPLTVSSGSGGVHVYFPFTEQVHRGEWQHAADRLKALCAAHSFDADGACTSDAARVLRPIGTRNFKNRTAPTKVTLLSRGEVTEFADIGTILAKACAACGASVTSIPSREKQLPAASSLNAQFTVPKSYPPSYAAVIAENCAQIGSFKAGEQQTEPVWYACLSVLRLTDESDLIAHEWSKADARYTHEQTAEKLARLKLDDIGPMSCGKFKELNPAKCAGCKHVGQITSPISLGRKSGSGTVSSNTLPPAPTVLQPSPPPPPLSAAPITVMQPTVAVAAQSFTGLVVWPSSPQEPLFTLESARAGRFIYTPPVPRIWLLKDCLPAGIVGGVIAPGGTGKTQALIQLGAAVAAGLPFCDTWETGEPGEALVLLAEDDDAEIHRRLFHIVRYLEEAYPNRGIKASVAKNLYIKSVIAENNLLTTLTHARTIHQTERLERVIATAMQLKNLKLIILDPVSRFRGGDENSAEDVTRFIEAVERIRSALPGVTLLVAHHTNKWSGQNEEQNQNASRGSSAFVDGIRFLMNLASLNKTDAQRVLPDERHLYLSATVTKSNYAPQQQAVFLKRGDGGVLTKTALPVAGGKGGGNILLDIVSRVLDSEPMSAYAFEAEFGGKTNVFEIGASGLRGHINQAIEAGYLIREVDVKNAKFKHLVVTEVGHAALAAQKAGSSK